MRRVLKAGECARGEVHPSGRKFLRVASLIITGWAVVGSMAVYTETVVHKAEVTRWQAEEERYYAYCEAGTYPKDAPDYEETRAACEADLMPGISAEEIQRYTFREATLEDQIEAEERE
jgi:hypothetical protein